jgi:hypothetical protein
MTDDMAEGIYSNLAVITHSGTEFVVDFIKMMPGVPKAKVKSRIILTPQHAKRLFRALKENIAKLNPYTGPSRDRRRGDALPVGRPGRTSIKKSSLGCFFYEGLLGLLHLIRLWHLLLKEKGDGAGFRIFAVNPLSGFSSSSAFGTFS